MLVRKYAGGGSWVESEGPMIILRLANGVWAHAGVRFTEWLGAVPLMGFGLAMYFQPDTLLTTPSFAVMLSWAGAAIWAMSTLFVANCRLIALFINGTFRSFPYSPLIRFIASCFASFFWSLVFAGVYIAWSENGGSPTAPIAYGTLMILEFRNAYVSRVDMAVTRGLNNARTKT